MANRDRYTQTEVEYGKPMAEIISGLLNEHSQSDAAAILNVNPATFWRWMKRAGVTRCYIVGEDCSALRSESVTA